MGEIPTWTSEASGISILSKFKTALKACPYKALYPPVLKAVLLNKNGENLPRCWIPGTELKKKLFTTAPSMIILLSSAEPPRINNPSCSPTLWAPGSVCKAEEISAPAPAVVTMSNGFKTVARFLSFASNEPAVIVTASNSVISSLSEKLTITVSFSSKILIVCVR